MNEWKYTYSDMLQITEKEKKKPINLLIGNGFSIAFDDVFRILESNNQNAGEHIVNMFSMKSFVELDDSIDSDNSKIIKILVFPQKAPFWRFLLFAGKQIPAKRPRPFVMFFSKKNIWRRMTNV